MEIIVDTESTSEGSSGGGSIVKVNVARNGFGGDSLRGVGPSCVGERGKRGGGGGRVVVEADVAFVGTDAKLVYDRHVS